MFNAKKSKKNQATKTKNLATKSKPKIILPENHAGLKAMNYVHGSLGRLSDAELDIIGQLSAEELVYICLTEKLVVKDPTDIFQLTFDIQKKVTRDITAEQNKRFQLEKKRLQTKMLADQRQNRKLMLQQAKKRQKVTGTNPYVNTGPEIQLGVGVNLDSNSSALNPLALLGNAALSSNKQEATHLNVSIQEQLSRANNAISDTANLGPVGMALSATTTKTTNNKQTPLSDIMASRLAQSNCPTTKPAPDSTDTALQSVMDMSFVDKIIPILVQIQTDVRPKQSSSADSQLGDYKKTVKHYVSTLRHKVFKIEGVDEFNANTVADWQNLKVSELNSVQSIGQIAYIRYFCNLLQIVDQTNFHPNAIAWWMSDFIAAFSAALTFMSGINASQANMVFKSLIEMRPTLGTFADDVKSIQHRLTALANPPDTNTDPRLSHLCMKKWYGKCQKGRLCKDSHVCVFCHMYHPSLSCEEKMLKVAPLVSERNANFGGNRGRGRGRRNRRSFYYQTHSAYPQYVQPAPQNRYHGRGRGRGRGRGHAPQFPQ